MATKKKATFETQMAQVEELLERMEAGNQPIEEALKDYEAGLKLLTGMEKELAEMRQRLTVLGESGGRADRRTKNGHHRPDGAVLPVDGAAGGAGLRGAFCR